MMRKNVVLEIDASRITHHRQTATVFVVFAVFGSRDGYCIVIDGILCKCQGHFFELKLFLCSLPYSLDIMKCVMKNI